MNTQPNEVPEWVTETPEPTTYALAMWDSSGGSIQEVPVDEKEFIALKSHLAKLRGFHVESDEEPEDTDTEESAPAPAKASKPQTTRPKLLPRPLDKSTLCGMYKAVEICRDMARMNIETRAQVEDLVAIWSFVSEVMDKMEFEEQPLPPLAEFVKVVNDLAHNYEIPTTDPESIRQTEPACV
jgi:hypothetical protein